MEAVDFHKNCHTTVIICFSWSTLSQATVITLSLFVSISDIVGATASPGERCPAKGLGSESCHDTSPVKTMTAGYVPGSSFSSEKWQWKVLLAHCYAWNLKVRKPLHAKY